MSWQFFLRSCDQVAVLVPRFVEDLHEPDAALEQPARQQAGVGERRLAGLGAVHLEDVAGLVGDLHHVRRSELHAEGHLERVDPGGDLGVADPLELHLVELPDGVELVALELVVDAARVGEIQHRVAAGPELDALVDGRQEAAAPVRVAAAGPLVARC